jgi:2-polyprenyl-3-methyl-5-hydroxy-6-metoxy-1,4-benzoquinol methylase
MEIMESPSWLITNHPNYSRWKKAREISIDRGKFVIKLISRFIECSSLNILELGSGEGGTALVFSKENNVISSDLSLIRLKRQSDEIARINTNALNLPFKQSSFDLIIMQDVIEHIPLNKELLHNLTSYLNKDGLIFLSTPNRFSLLNFISDPHFGLPFISILKREQIKNYFLPLVRKDDSNRNDLAQLLSLMEINKISSDYNIILNTKFTVTELFNGNKGIIWSDFHLKLIDLIKKMRLKNLLLGISNDKESFLNKFITPTFYLVLKKK